VMWFLRKLRCVM